MTGPFSKCGARCDACPAYRENARTAAHRQRCSDGWHKYLGVRLQPERCFCDGCQTPDDQNPTLVIGRRGCAIRRCAVASGVVTCAHCAAYPCEAVQAQFSFDQGSRQRIGERLGAPVPEEDYLAFIEPYELFRHLDEILAGLRAKDIVQPRKPPTYQARTVDFPQDLSGSAREVAAFKALHDIIRGLSIVDADTHVLLERLKDRRTHLLKLMWTFGLLGEWDEEGGPHLVLDGDVYLAQKLSGNYNLVVKSYLPQLARLGVRVELVPLADDWLLPSGWMRRRGKTWDAGWLTKMSFAEQASGADGLRALQTYVRALEQEHGKQAYRRFARADMSVLVRG